MEHDPDLEVIGKVLEPMRNSRSHEQQVARLERVSLAVVKQDTSATHDDVHLVLRVRSRLSGRWTRREATEGESNVERAAPQHAGGVFARGAGNGRASLGKTDDTATISLVHALTGWTNCHCVGRSHCMRNFCASAP